MTFEFEVNKMLGTLFLILLIILRILTKASTAIIEGPENSIYPKGSNIELKCVVQEMEAEILWLDTGEDTVIFINKVKNTEKEKFDNFHISEREEDFSVTITDAQVSDDGHYSCREGDDNRDADVFIEEYPVLSIKVTVMNTVQKGLSTEAILAVIAGELLIIQCKAEKAKPAVYLRLKVDDSLWLISINHTQQKDGQLFVTEAFYSHVVEKNNTQITCQAYGQDSILPVETTKSLIVVYEPICTLHVGSKFVECQCSAMPAVTDYKISVDGKIISNQSRVLYEGHIPGNFTCVASNAVGEGKLIFLYVSALRGNLIIAVAVPVAAALLTIPGFVLLYRKLKRRLSRLQNNREECDGANDNGFAKIDTTAND